MQAQALQENERNQDQSDMPHQGSIHTSLAGRQTAELFGVLEKGFDGPADPLPQHDGGQVTDQVIGSQHLLISMTVFGHDEADGTILGR